MFINVINYNSTSVRRYVLPPMGPVLTCRPDQPPTITCLFEPKFTGDIEITRKHAARLLKDLRQYNKEQRNGQNV